MVELLKKLKIIKDINKISEFYDIVEILRKLSPESSSDAEYLRIKEFMRFSPEKLARKLNIDEIEFSKKVNKIKGEFNKKIKYVIRMEKMNSILPKIGNQEIKISGKSITVISKHCICTNDYCYNSYVKYNFYKGIIYSYFIHQDAYSKEIVYCVMHRNKSGYHPYQLLECKLSKGSFFSNFTDLRDWKIDQII